MLDLTEELKCFEKALFCDCCIYKLQR